MKNKLLSSALFICTLLMYACGSDEVVTTATKVDTLVTKSPFEFYKRIEIRPGISFEAISWGKGVDTLGGYSIMMADSVHHQYKAVNGERNGKTIAFWNLDLDNDGNPELYLQTLSNKNQSDLLVHEIENSNFNKINFPALSAKTKSRFLGNDKFYIKGGELFRSIPVKSEKSGAPDTVMTIQYVISNNSFSIKDVK